MASSLTTLVRTDKPPIVFVSYSHKDEALKDELLPHLKQLERVCELEVWDDRRIKAGVDWYAEIKDVLSRTKVAVCLISKRFLDSSFCMDEEIAYLLQARNRGDLEIIPVLVKDCTWKPHRWLKRLQMLPRDGKNVTTDFAQDPDQIFSQVSDLVYEMLQPGYEFERPPPAGEPPEKEDIKRLPQNRDLLFGRRNEMEALDGIWNKNELNVAVFKASGGVGKSSLVRAWVEDMALDNYRGAKRVFAWSFYSQGTQERVASADEFISYALGWFGDVTRGEGKSPWDRGQRLAELVQEKRTLLLLDGLEPLQSGQSYDRGKIKDPGLEMLLDELGRSNPGLCLISTREEVSDLWHETDECQVKQYDLDTISKTAGRALLRVSGIEGEDTALEQAVQSFGRHAYAVKLLGSFLFFCNTPHIEHAADVPDLPGVEENEGKHPRRVMAAFAEHFGDSAKSDILAMLGLFDRPAGVRCIAALRKEPAVPGLNAAVLPISEATWQEQIKELRELGLLTPESHHAKDELDAHPLVREHFGVRLRTEQKDAWKAGHECLYKHLKTVPDKHQPDTLTEMAPLFQAVHHGCQAGRHQEALSEVYSERIVRGGSGYLVHKLGAFSAELDLLAAFLDNQWSKPSGQFPALVDAKLLGRIAFILHAQGALNHAADAMQAGNKAALEQRDWDTAATGSSNLAEVYLALGDIQNALKFSEEAIGYADLSGDPCRRMTARTNLADALHQANNIEASLSIFEEAEKISPETRFGVSKLFGMWSYRYCDLLLSLGSKEKAARQASYASSVFQGQKWLLDIALDYLSLGRAAMALNNREEAHSQFNQTVDSLRKAGTIHNLPLGLLARAAFFREVEEYERSRRDLDEVMRLSVRCGMRLHECDAHLEYARLEIKQGQPDAARDHVKSAAKLVEDCGYHRRDGELLELKEELGL